MSAHNDRYIKLFAGSLAAAEFVSFTQLLTKTASDLPRLQLDTVVIFSFSMPLLISFFLRPPSFRSPVVIWDDIIHLCLFLVAIFSALVGFDLLFWSVSWIAGASFPLASIVAFYATFLLHTKTSR